MIDFSHVVPITIETYSKNNLPIEGEVAKIKNPVGNLDYWPYQLLVQLKTEFEKKKPTDPNPIIYQTKQDS